MEIKELRRNAMSLPLSAGVYIMKNKQGKIIYIGKAKKLKNRVSSYFGSDKNHTAKVKKMVSQVDDFEYIICDSEFEALILECSLIKQHSPKYNILLKDDKGYHYIKITKSDWPVICEVKQKLNDGAEYLGPYNSGWILKQTIDEAEKIYKLRSCRKSFPADFKKSRPCLNFYIGRCMAPCTGKVKNADYLEAVNAAVSFIKGTSAHTAEAMEKEMMEAAEQLDFEKAAKLRDRINALRKATEKQKVVTSSYKNQDVIASTRNDTALAFAVMSFRNGHLSDLNCYMINEPNNLLDDRTEFLERYYSQNDDIPPRIVLDGEINNTELAEEFLSSKAQKKVSVIIPQKGEQFDLVKMCALNAAEFLTKSMWGEAKEAAALDELSRLLNLPSPPRYIEAYDISHTAGSENVAGMTVFEDGKPLKKAYKRFRIKSFSGQDDYRSMAEVIDRRFTEYEQLQKDTSAPKEGFGILPDLILLDGGLGQLNAVLPILNKHNITVPVFGMVKDSKHKTRAVAAAGGEISIKANRRAYTLISEIQEETHRFAITYHRQSAAKKGLQAELESINGLGPKRVKLLLKTFKNINEIKGLSAKELNEKTGIPMSVCLNIENFYS